MKRVLVIAGVVVLVLGVAVWAYTKFAPRPSSQQGDPALAVALAFGALERSGERRLTDEQVKTVLPLLRVLRDLDPNDTETSRALAEQIRKVLTAEQRAALQQIREEAQARRQAGQAQRPGGFGEGQGVGQSGRPGSRAEFRKRVLSRLIERLESRIQ